MCGDQHRLSACRHAYDQCTTQHDHVSHGQLDSCYLALERPWVLPLVKGVQERVLNGAIVGPNEDHDLNPTGSGELPVFML